MPMPTPTGPPPLLFVDDYLVNLGRLTAARFHRRDGEPTTCHLFFGGVIGTGRTGDLVIVGPEAERFLRWAAGFAMHLFDHEPEPEPIA